MRVLVCAKQLLKEEVIAKGSCLVSASCVVHTQPHHMQFCLLQNKNILLKCVHNVHVFGHTVSILFCTAMHGALQHVLVVFGGH